LAGVDRDDGAYEKGLTVEISRELKALLEKARNLFARS
jgi:hypothetical protein